MALPREIIHMIYGIALVRGKIFVPTVMFKDLDVVGAYLHLEKDTRGAYMPFKSRDWRGERYPRYQDYEYYRYGPPITVGLLQGVCKFVQSETEVVFYGLGNHFVLPAGYYRNPPMFPDYRLLDRPRPRIPPFKSIGITFDFREQNEDRSSRREDIRSSRNCFFPMRDDNDKTVYLQGRQVLPRERPSHIHNSLMVSLQLLWRERVFMIKESVKGLRHLEIDLEECFCPLGCCRISDGVIRTFDRFPKSLKQLSITGLVSAAEALNLMHIIKDAQEAPHDNVDPLAIGLFLADQGRVKGGKFVRTPRLETSISGIPGPVRPPDFAMYGD